MKALAQISHSIMMKVNAELEVQKLRKELLTSMTFTSKICACRSLKELVIQINEYLPRFLGFNGAGILIQNKEAKELYSIPIYKEDKS